MIVFSLFLFILMLILGGMAVDFMRFESRRAALQGATDRCVLAAANMSKANQAAAIASDCMIKAGYGAYMEGPPVVNGDANYRSVQINAKLPMDTFFLKLVDINTLEAPSTSRAIEGAGNIEISLVLDVSGSMKDPTTDSNGNPTATSKIAALRAAATSFVNTVLTLENKDKVSISLVPYSQHVNVGPTLFNRLQTNHKHNFSHCVEFPDAELSKVELNTTLTYEQGHHFQSNGDYQNGAYQNTVTDTVCPRYSYERITHITQDKLALTTQISQLQPRAGTSIFLGLKWGVALLDQSTRALVASGLDPAFAGRPYNYSSANSPIPTQKVIVLMTDGRNDWSNNIQDWAYNEPSEYFHWSKFNYQYWWRVDQSGLTEARPDRMQINRYRRVDQSGVLYSGYPSFDGTLADTLMSNLCTAAKKKNIIIFTIAFEAPEDGQIQMANCATSPAHYFEASGGEITAIFEAIADQITALRLTL